MENNINFLERLEQQKVLLAEAKREFPTKYGKLEKIYTDLKVLLKYLEKPQKDEALELMKSIPRPTRSSDRIAYMDITTYLLWAYDVLSKKRPSRFLKRQMNHKRFIFEDSSNKKKKMFEEIYERLDSF